MENFLKLEIGGIKPGEIEVHAKVSDNGFYEVHLDTDDANAFLINPGDIGVFEKMSFYIGNVKINGQIVVAPMAGISNMTF